MYNIIIIILHQLLYNCTAVFMKLVFHVGFIEHPVRLLKIIIYVNSDHEKLIGFNLVGRVRMHESTIVHIIEVS